jgi:hypothetical protein
LFEFVWLPAFERSARKLLDEQDRRAIEGILCEDLRAGSVVKRTGGIRKLRYAAEGRGKRGGMRIIYLLDEPCERVYLALAYAKSDHETLTKDEEGTLRRLSRALTQEPCR